MLAAGTTAGIRPRDREAVGWLPGPIADHVRDADGPFRRWGRRPIDFLSAWLRPLGPAALM
jgi:hypothetical protein